MTEDKHPQIIMSRQIGQFSRGGITIEIDTCRSEHTKWSPEVVDTDNNSIVGNSEFATYDEAYAEVLSSVETEGLDGVLRDRSRMH